MLFRSPKNGRENEKWDVEKKKKRNVRWRFKKKWGIGKWERKDKGKDEKRENKKRMMRRKKRDEKKKKNWEEWCDMLCLVLS